MKKLFYIVLLLGPFYGFAQNKGMTYQAVIYAPGGQNLPGYDLAKVPMANRTICLQFSFLDERSSLEYQEEVKIKTDEFGMVNITIGSGNQTGGYASSYAAIAWSAAAEKSFKVALDATGLCSQFDELSVGKLESVPFANAAITAVNVSGIVALANGGTAATTAPGARTNLGLGNVDNTSDVNKPVSTATQTALNLKANTADVTTSLALKANTSDVTSSLNLKANTADVTTSLALKANAADVTTSLATKANLASPTFTGTVSGIDKTMVGLPNVENTSDANKPVSTATQTALNAKANTADVTTSLALKANTVDVTTSLTTKVDKVTGKALSTNDYTTAEKTKLAAITGTNTGDQDLSGYAITSDVTTSLATKANASDVTTSLATKVDKVTGKALSTNDYTTAEKDKLAAITGTNTGDQDLSALATNTALALKANATDVTTSLATKVDKVTGKALSTNDYTTAEKTKLAAITGTNTGDQDLSGYAITSDVTTSLATKANASDVTTSLAAKANTADVTSSLALKANAADVISSLALKANTADVSTSLALKANTTDMTTSLATKANAADVTTSLATKVDKVTGKELSTNDYTTAEKDKLAAITGTNTGDQVNITGNAGTATKLQSSVTINGIAFDGSANITVPAGVPYTGATGAVNLGAYDLTVNGITVGIGGGNQAYNTVIGEGALPVNTTGEYNTANGAYALYNNTTGQRNTAVGIAALEYNTEGSQNTAIGIDAGVAFGSGTISNTTAIGSGAKVSASNTIQLGNTDVRDVKTSGAITAGGKIIAGASSAASSSAVLEANSTTQGFLPPRLTTTERDAISSPVAGLTIWNTTNTQLEVYDGSYWKNMVGLLVSPLNIGDNYGGGKVFYIFGPSDIGFIKGQTHGLIASASDLGPADGVRWFPGAFYGATATNLGTGIANTALIMVVATVFNTNVTSYAAGLANSCRDGGYVDWFLPSKDELNKLYQQKDLIGGFVNADPFGYWSSSQKGQLNVNNYMNGISSAHFQRFDNGLQGDTGLSEKRRVRAIRIF